jgi:hypothetical protein
MTDEIGGLEHRQGLQIRVQLCVLVVQPGEGADCQSHAETQFTHESRAVSM